MGFSVAALRVLVGSTVALAGISALILVVFLVRRPPLGGMTKAWLLMGIGVLSPLAALAGNIVGFEASKRREFCGSCHTMTPYVADAADSGSKTLAAFHSRNEHQGEVSCYVCHKNYGLFASATTKVRGFRHLWAYYTHPDRPPKLYSPYLNRRCTECHSMTLPGFDDEPEHATIKTELRAGTTSCVTAGCHAPVHPSTGGKKS